MTKAASDTAEFFVLDSARLSETARAKASGFREARPFPHAVMDDFLPPEALRQVLTEFPKPGDIEWETFDDPSQKKLGSRLEAQMGPATRMLLYQLNSSVFLEFLEELTGIEGLIPDPYFGGGGLHQIERDGFLEVHADFNWHPKLQLDRRLNLLLYLNEEWEEEYGGHLELWNRDMTASEADILPVFNRCVVFETTDTSFHGHPKPLRCPPGRSRKSIALYYYTNGRPETERSSPHNTLFQQRPDGPAPYDPARPPGFAAGLHRFLRQVVPPICFDVWAKLRGK